MRTIVFVDGQNLYHLAKLAWGPREQGTKHRYSWPSYDVVRLAQKLVAIRSNHKLVEIRFYTGVPNPRYGRNQQRWFDFWENKIAALEAAGVYVYRGTVNRFGQEKGVDVSLAIDLVRATYERRYDSAIIISQDADFGPAIRLCKQIASRQGRQLSMESTFPVPPNRRKWRRGIPGTVWSALDRGLYDDCYDPADYRPRKLPIA